jgi:hypothetical protein
MWVGLDGSGRRDLPQAGTEQDSQTTSFGTFTLYYAWIEYFPDPEMPLLGLGVHPGDHMAVWTWVGDASGNIDASGGHAWFYLWNQTRNTAVGNIGLAIPSGQTFAGTSAEWIIEEPQEVGISYGLSNFRTAVMSNVMAYDTSWNAHPYAGSNAAKMYQGNDLLAYPHAIDSKTIGYTWVNYN